MLHTDYDQLPSIQSFLKYLFSFLPSNKHRAKLPNSKLHFVITGRKHKAPVQVSAASAVPPIYIASCIGIANKETTGTICHSFIAVLLFFSPNQPLRCSLVIYIFACKTNCSLCLFQDTQSYQCPTPLGRNTMFSCHLCHHWTQVLPLNLPVWDTFLKVESFTEML